MSIKHALIPAFLVTLTLSSTAEADMVRVLSKYQGYTIAAVKTIDKWVSDDRTKSGDSFEGCDFGRYIVFDDGTYLRCNEYQYDYGYRPEAVILTKGSRVVMLVGDDSYDTTF